MSTGNVETIYQRMVCYFLLVASPLWAETTNQYQLVDLNMALKCFEYPTFHQENKKIISPIYIIWLLAEIVFIFHYLGDPG